MYPVPKYSLASTPFPVFPGIAEDKVHPFQTFLTIPIRPSGPPSTDTQWEDKFHPRVQSSEDLLAPATQKKFNKAHALVASKEAEMSKIFPGSDVEVTTLGTGSALPTKYRNVLANLIRIPGYGSILLDCGEGTWGQLARQFGEDGAADILRDLKCIFVSHVHGDHHMGLTKLLWKRKQLMTAANPPTHPLYLITIRAVHLYLREVSNLFNLGLVNAQDAEKAGPGDVVAIMTEALHWRKNATYPTSGMWAIGGDEDWTDMQASRNAIKLMSEVLGLTGWRTIDVMHRTRCYGCQIKHKDGWSIV
jgi:ribonuclease Z